MIEKMKFAELQEDLNKKKDLIAGIKAVLLSRLKEALGKEYPMHCEITNTTPKK